VLIRSYGGTPGNAYGAFVKHWYLSHWPAVG
jgi:hypothetical protein